MSVEWLSTEKAAKKCGLKTSRFNELVRLCGIPYGGTPRRRLYDPAVLDDWIRRNFIPGRRPPQRHRRRGPSPELRATLADISPRLAEVYDESKGVSSRHVVRDTAEAI